MIAVPILSLSFWNAYVDINSDMFATAEINNDKFGVSELFPTANKDKHGSLILVIELTASSIPTRQT